LSGEYAYVAGSSASLDLTLQVQDSEGRDVATFPERVTYKDDAETIINTTGPTVVFSPGQSGKEKASIVNQAIVKPKVEVTEGHVCAPKGSCAVTVMVDGNPCPIESEDGVAIATIGRGSRYELLLANQSKHAAVANVSIDGLDVFAFSELSGKPAGFVVPAGGTNLVKGWFVSTARADTFVVGKFADSAAANELGGGATAGVIVVKFQVAWPMGESPPDEEHPVDLPRGSDGTLRGEPVQQNLDTVELEIGSLREIVSIRYGS